MSFTYPHHATGQPAGVAPNHASGLSSPLSSFQPSSGPHSANLYSNTKTDQGAPSSFPSSSSSSSSQRQQGLTTVAPRSTSLPFARQMGTSQSKPSVPVVPPVASTSTHPPSAASKSLTAAVAGGIKLKRAFARRRKISGDASSMFLPKGKEQELRLKSVVSSSSLAIDKAVKPLPSSVGPFQRSSPPRVETFSTPAAHSTAPRNIDVLPQQQQPPSPPPPLPPKKDFSAPPLVPPPEQRPATEVLSAGSRNSIMPISPGISSAVNYISMMDQQQNVGSKQEADKENVKGVDKREMKESWRKSDSTNSHHTIRPAGTGNASKSSRPVSWAESFQSTHTIVQASNRRLSALIGDADFGMAEEDDDDSSSAPHAPTSSPSSVRSKNRRSMSLNLEMTNTSKFTMTPPPSAPATELKYPSHSISEGLLPPNSLSHTPLRAPAVSPSASQPHSESAAGTNLRGHFAAWTTPAGNPYVMTPTQAPPHARNLSPMHPQQYQQQPPSSASSPSSSAASAPSSFRQTAISMSTGVGPAAAGLAKRAVEKMGRKWAMGMGMSSSSSGSGSWSTTSSSTTNGPSSVSSSSHFGDVLARTSSNQSTPSVHSNFFMGSPSKSLGGGKHTRTTGGTGSISSGISSDPDFFANPAGPMLGTKLRGALRSKNGVQVVAGVVFGRELVAGVRETSVKIGKAPGADGPKKEGLLGELEERLLAAVAVRCAQHLLVWGVQEEGLFRVTGRSSHASKLRAEFDSGADYDMMACSPGDLDPHAVSSVFKAYLRELPEPVLTQRLQPLFDAAINKEATVNASELMNAPRQMRGQGLPSGPKNGFTGLRKPPSLSTLAMPSFTGIPPPSKPLVAVLRTLIKQLPAENRDLVRTIVDLIKETATRVKETKMPLTNLLVVFCPSLNMTPPLLKVLCEAEGIWSEESEPEMPVIDIRRLPEVAPVPVSAKEGDVLSDTSSGINEESDSLRSGRPSLDNPSSDYHGSAENSIYEGQVRQRRRGHDYERAEVPTVYLDSRSRCSSSSASLSHEPVADYGQPPYMHHSRDDGSISSDNYSMNGGPMPSLSPPPLSSSAESVATPTSSSNPSFADLPLKSEEKDHEDPHGYQHHHIGSGPQIADPTPLELRPQESKRPLISNPIPVVAPVQFPVGPQSKPAPVATRRRSIPTLSLPSFSPVTSPLGTSPSPSPAPSPKNAGPSPGQGLRAKKPSLKLLFSKRSTSSLNSTKDRSSTGISFISVPTQQQHVGYSPKSGSDSSVSTPLSAVTAPQSSFPGSASSTQLQHVLDTPIECSSLSMDLGFDVSPPTTATLSDKQFAPTPTKSSASNEASSSSVYNIPAVKPLSINPKRTIKPGESHIRPQASSSNLSISSTTSSHHLSLFDDDDDDEQMEDWTQSVLLAADMDGKWAIQKPATAISTDVNARETRKPDAAGSKVLLRS